MLIVFIHCVYVGSLTTVDAVLQPYQLMVALDSNYEATGDVYFDDGETLNTDEFIFSTFEAKNGQLSNSIVNKTYTLTNKGYLNEIRILGIENSVAAVNVSGDNGFKWTYNSTSSFLTIKSLSLDISQQFRVSWQSKSLKQSVVGVSSPQYT